MRRFSRRRLLQIDETKYFYLRAGPEHRFIAVWSVVVDGRVFVRSWNDKPGGWYRAFLRERRGHVRLGDVAVPVRAFPLRSAALIDAATRAYGQKYRTKSNAKYVRGFAAAKRKANTLELRPA